MVSQNRFVVPRLTLDCRVILLSSFTSRPSRTLIISSVYQLSSEASVEAFGLWNMASTSSGSEFVCDSALDFTITFPSRPVFLLLHFRRRSNSLFYIYEDFFKIRSSSIYHVFVAYSPARRAIIVELG